MVVTAEMEAMEQKLRAELRLEEGRKDFLIAEYSHFAESFLHNEEDGDRRATFFITVAGIFAGLVGNASAETLTAAHDYLVAGLVAVLSLGIFTFMRIVRRNLNADKYLAGLARLRRLFFAADVDWVLVESPRETTQRRFTDELKKSGWLAPVAVVNGLIVFVLGAVQKAPRSWNVTAGILTAAVLMAAGAYERHHKRKKSSGQDEARRSSQTG